MSVNALKTAANQVFLATTTSAGQPVEVEGAPKSVATPGELASAVKRDEIPDSARNGMPTGGPKPCSPSSGAIPPRLQAMRQDKALSLQQKLEGVASGEIKTENRAQQEEILRLVLVDGVNKAVVDAYTGVEFDAFGLQERNKIAALFEERQGAHTDFLRALDGMLEAESAEDIEKAMTHYKKTLDALIGTFPAGADKSNIELVTKYLDETAEIKLSIIKDCETDLMSGIAKADKEMSLHSLLHQRQIADLAVAAIKSHNNRQLELINKFSEKLELELVNPQNTQETLKRKVANLLESFCKKLDDELKQLRGASTFEHASKDGAGITLERLFREASDKIEVVKGDVLRMTQSAMTRMTTLEKVHVISAGMVLELTMSEIESNLEEMDNRLEKNVRDDLLDKLSTGRLENAGDRKLLLDQLKLVATDAERLREPLKGVLEILGSGKELSTKDRNILAAAAKQILTPEEAETTLAQIRKLSAVQRGKYEGKLDELLDSVKGDNVTAIWNFRGRLQAVAELAQATLAKNDLAVFESQIAKVMDNATPFIYKHLIGDGKISPEDGLFLRQLLQDSEFNLNALTTILSSGKTGDLRKALATEILEERTKIMGNIFLEHPELDDFALFLAKRVYVGDGGKAEFKEMNAKGQAAAENRHESERLVRACKNMLAHTEMGKSKRSGVNALLKLDSNGFLSAMKENMGVCIECDIFVLRALWLREGANNGDEGIESFVKTLPQPYSNLSSEEFKRYVGTGAMSMKAVNAGQALVDDLSGELEGKRSPFLLAIGNITGKQYDPGVLLDNLLMKLAQPGDLGNVEIVLKPILEKIRGEDGANVSQSGTFGVGVDSLALLLTVGSKGTAKNALQDFFMTLGKQKSKNLAELTNQLNSFANSKYDGELLLERLNTLANLYDRHLPYLHDIFVELGMTDPSKYDDAITTGTGMATLLLSLDTAVQMYNAETNEKGGITASGSEKRESELAPWQRAQLDILLIKSPPKGSDVLSIQMDRQGKSQSSKHVNHAVRDAIAGMKTAKDEAAFNSAVKRLTDLMNEHELVKRAEAMLAFKKSNSKKTETIEEKLKDAVSEKNITSKEEKERKERLELRQEAGDQAKHDGFPGRVVKRIAPLYKSVDSQMVKQSEKMKASYNLSSALEDSLNDVAIAVILGAYKTAVLSSDGDITLDGFINELLDEKSRKTPPTPFSEAVQLMAGSIKKFSNENVKESAAKKIAERFILAWAETIKNTDGGAGKWLGERADEVIDPASSRKALKLIGKKKGNELLNHFRDLNIEDILKSLKPNWMVDVSMSNETKSSIGNFSLGDAVGNGFSIIREGDRYGVVMNRETAKSFKFEAEFVKIFSASLSGKWADVMGVRVDFPNMEECSDFLKELVNGNKPKISGEMTGITHKEIAIEAEAAMDIRKVTDKGKGAIAMLEAIRNDVDAVDNRSEVEANASVKAGGMLGWGTEESGNKIVAKLEGKLELAFSAELGFNRKSIKKKAGLELHSEIAATYVDGKMTGSTMSRMLTLEKDDFDDNDNASEQIGEVLKEMGVRHSDAAVAFIVGRLKLGDVEISIESSLTDAGFRAYENAHKGVARGKLLANKENYGSSVLKITQSTSFSSVTEVEILEEKEAEDLGGLGLVPGVTFQSTAAGTMKKSWEFKMEVA